MRGSTTAEDEAIVAGFAHVGTRAILPMLRDAAQRRPELAERLSALHAQLKRPAPAAREEAGVKWVEAGGGKLAVGPRPKLRALAGLQAAGATHLVTLLAASEGARQLGGAAGAAGLGWLWLPLANGDPPALARVPDARAALDAWNELLAGGAALYIHCAAGDPPHGHDDPRAAAADRARTGRRAQAARRAAGADRAEVGEARLAWGARLFELQ